MTATSTTPAAPAKSVASATLRTFALTFSLAFVVTYLLCEVMGWPLFTYFPATDRLFWGYEGIRRGEGPQMFWYGWLATSFIASSVIGGLATLMPADIAKRIPLALVWILPIIALVILAYTLMPFWTK